jgi:hypothetical protein
MKWQRFLYAAFFAAVFVFVVIGGRDALSSPPGYIYRCGGTGFLHVTNDVEDSNCLAIDLASSDVKSALPQSKGGTGLVSPGPAGNALVSNGSSWTSGPVGGLSVALDCDWTAQSSQVLNTAAPFTACGKTWHSEPNIFGRGDTRIVSGTGLVIQTNTGGSGYGAFGGGGVKNAPLVELPFSELALPAAFDTMTSQMRICAWIPSQTITGATAGGVTGAFFGVDNDPTQGTAPTNWFSLVLIRTATNPTTPALSLQAGFGSWTSTLSSSYAAVPGVSAWTSAVSTACMMIPSLAPVQNLSASYGGAYSAGFPTQIPWNYYFIGNAGSGTTGLIGYTNPLATAIGSRFGVVVGASNDSAFAHPDTVTFARIRVEYRL